VPGFFEMGMPSPTNKRDKRVRINTRKNFHTHKQVASVTAREATRDAALTCDDLLVVRRHDLGTGDRENALLERSDL
jgi:hypothetical protein